jgi:hypothetical protein
MAAAVVEPRRACDRRYLHPGGDERVMEQLSPGVVADSGHQRCRPAVPDAYHGAAALMRTSGLSAWQP